MPRLKKAYRSIIKHPVVDKTVHRSLNALVGGIARARGFSFPKKFNWDWKWEMLAGLYEKETVALCRRVMKPGMHVADIGAHAGYFTRLYSKLVGPTGMVYAFEPDPENHALLQLNTRTLKNVRIFPLAISNQVGAVDFFETENNTGCHSLIPAGFRPNKITVQATTLDALTKSGTLPKIDFLKMDIEGAEPIALQGMKETIAANPKLGMIIEFCPGNLTDSGTDPTGFIEELRAMGLRIFAIKDEGLREITSEDAKAQRFSLKGHYVNLFVGHDAV
jgi:FkbM family methyltransferase